VKTGTVSRLDDAISACRQTHLPLFRSWPSRHPFVLMKGSTAGTQVGLVDDILAISAPVDILLAINSVLTSLTDHTAAGSSEWNNSVIQTTMQSRNEWFATLNKCYAAKTVHQLYQIQSLLYPTAPVTFRLRRTSQASARLRHRVPRSGSICRRGRPLRRTFFESRFWLRA
jgi:hypothetical protein